MPLSRSRLLLAVLITASAAGLAPAPALASQAPADQPYGNSRLQRRLEELVHAPGGPPGAVAVLRRGERTEVVRAGVAEVGTGRRPQATDHMRIASVAKAFSGAVALGLVDQGVLGLDDTIGDRLPALPAAWGAVTLRQLLNHTSGLPDFSAAPAFREIILADPHHRFDSRHLLDFVADQPLNFPPGTAYQYSNSDNIAVALMAEAASGRRYEELLHTLVDQPLGLRETTLPQGFELPEPYLHGYAVQPPAPPEDVSTLIGASGVWASGGIVSTPDDLGTFMGAYAGGRLIAPAVHAQQLTFVDGASEPAGPGRNEAGLAIFRYTTRCGTVYGHTGNTPGYTQLAVGTPDGSRSLTFSITTQVNQSGNPQLLGQLRDVQEDFVCSLLQD
ncbi:serine hydrolase domain-containing protein [Streptomyces sp. NPDC006692]|uniref:serine hydrolase domain-containing protein n=1 Tax=Streptomyces sp. NPDC006692 TaxID=3364758 RepID=UPI0036C595D4